MSTDLETPSFDPPENGADSDPVLRRSTAGESRGTPRRGRRLRRLTGILWGLWFLWGFGVIRYGAIFAGSSPLANLGQVVLGTGWIGLALSLPRARERRAWRILALVLGAFVLGSWITASPSNDRDWVSGHRRSPRIAFDDSAPNRVTIENVRNHRYRSRTEVREAFENRTLDLERVRDLDFIVIPFAKGWRGPAHTMLSFGFDAAEEEDGVAAAPPPRLVISIEARRERGEAYSPLAGLFRRYEVCFVIADEQDALALRVDHSDDPVQIHRTRATAEQARSILTALLEEAKRSGENPAFYHTLLRNCTTGIVAAVARVLEEAVPLDHRVVFPGYTDEIAHERGWLEEKGTLEEVRRAATVEPVAPHPDSRVWSARLRERR